MTIARLEQDTEQTTQEFEYGKWYDFCNSTVKGYFIGFRNANPILLSRADSFLSAESFEIAQIYSFDNLGKPTRIGFNIFNGYLNQFNSWRLGYSKEGLEKCGRALRSVSALWHKLHSRQQEAQAA